MPTAPGASRPTRLHDPKQSTMPTPKPPAPKRSASAPTPRAPHSSPKPKHRPSTSSAHQYRSKPTPPRPPPRSAQPSRSRSAPNQKSSSRTHQKSSGRTSQSSPRSSHSSLYAFNKDHSRSAGQKSSTQHVHRQPGSSSSRPVYVVCNRKHYDDGIYARCQRLLRKYVKWGR